MPVSVKKYELTFILGETATVEDATAKTTELSAAIKELGGEVTKDEQWGRRDLAYPIARSRSGIYATLWLDLPSDQLKELDRKLRFDETVIRSLVTVAYTTAQPGSLYPVPEEEKKGRRGDREEAPAGAEEQLRRSSRSSKTEKTEDVEDAEQLSEADRLAQLDSRLDSLLNDEESAK
jgi:small subunit ribosomal protein S6